MNLTTELQELESRIHLVERASNCRIDGPYPADPITNGGCNWLVAFSPRKYQTRSGVEAVSQRIEMLQCALPKVAWPRSLDATARH